jgi:hypothetical protein
MRIKAMLTVLAMLLVPSAAHADGAWGGPIPLLDCGRQITNDRVFKEYATDLIGNQIVRYYLHVTWCYRRVGGAVTRTAAEAWGETGARGSWNFTRNLNGPTVTGRTIYARGEFEYHWPPGPLRLPAGTAQPWLRVTQLGGPNYTCAGGIQSGKFGQRISNCVVALEKTR